VLLAAGALILLANAGVTLGRQVLSTAMPGPIIELLDRVLLVVMLVELLYTVQVSFREHTLVPEPFLIVGLVAATRRVLVLTAEFTGGKPQNDAAFQVSMIELSILTLMIVALVGSLLMLRHRNPDAIARRA